MYAYLIGVLLTFLFWLVFFVFKPSIRKAMIWTGFAYVAFNLFLLGLWHLFGLFMYVGESLIPSYWDPEMLFDLGRWTGVLGIEDLFYIFFIGGGAACLYEYVSHHKISEKRTYRPHLLSLIVCASVFIVLAHFLPYNILYSNVIATMCGVFVLWFQRRDLIYHSFVGGLVFLFLYVIGYEIFLVIFPGFIQNAYSLNNLSGVFLFGLPLEEFLYAFSSGMLLAPLYEYVHGEKCIKEKRYR